ncbi:MAG: NUDIX domain-containing protein [Clostridia bacterium]|nr:NUDIX domain-containing protein [Clostridia bacterium]
MISERSCGAVLYKMVEGEPHYVLVKSTFFGFPKGHVESGESDDETALREIAEETGVRFARLDTSFRREIVYNSPRKSGLKQVVLFLAECGPNAKPRANREIKEIAVVPREQALGLLKREALRQVLIDADSYIRSSPAVK